MLEGPGAAKINELQDVIDLINHVFRESKGLAPKMHKEFTLLLCEENIDHVRVITDEGKVVSVMSF